MKATEGKIIRFLEGHDKKFIIPVYQRNYDWNQDNCKQLFQDLKDVIENERKSHFFGSIVFIYNDDSDDDQEFIIIDGQQRITTLTLLMLAMVHEEEERKNDEIESELIKNEYLIGKYNQKEKIKLKPVKDDKKAFEVLFTKIKEDFIPSNITNNYLFFREILKAEKIKNKQIELSEIFSAIKKLDVVEIKLKSSEDDPQLIFESLNSTGLDLSEADKVRNYILMGLRGDTQEKYYENYWNKIEQLSEYRVSDFLRDYITLKERKTPNKNRVYFAFKEYIHKKGESNIEKGESKIEDILKELLVYAKYYNSIIQSKHKNSKIQKILEDLNHLELTVVYPFLLEVFDDHIRLNIITEENLYSILSVTESFIVRRWICDLPSNALNKIFMTLGQDIKKYKDYQKNYLEILKYILSQKKASQRFPNDEEFKGKMLFKDLYNIKAKYKLHIFSRIENFNNKERVDIQKLLDDNHLSMEHVMPQTLSYNWTKALGENFKAIHEKYLHTIGNLTFTAYNTELSNKTFSEKKIIEGGFNDSRFYLNEFLKSQTEWNEKKITERAEILVNKSLKIWSYVATSYSSEEDIENTYSLDDDYDFTGTKIKYFQIFGEKKPVSSWVNFYENLCKIFYNLEATKFLRLLNDEDFKKKSIISSEDADFRKPLKVSENIYVEGNLSSETILSYLRMICNKLDIDQSDVNICLQEKVK